MNFNKVNKYYNARLDNINQYIDLNKNFDYIFSDNDDNVVDIYTDKKLCLKAEYSIVGMYNIPVSVWYWGWNIAFVNKNLIAPLNAIKDFSNTIIKDFNKFNQKEAEELFYITNNSNFYISNKNIDKILKITLFLTKGIWIFPVNYDVSNDKNKSPEEMNKITYILITKILQYG